MWYSSAMRLGEVAGDKLGAESTQDFDGRRATQRAAIAVHIPGFMH